MSHAPRVAILGVFLESNSFSAPATESGFRDLLFLEDQQVLDEARAQWPRLMKEAVGFVSRMDETGPWNPLPLIVTSGGASGPADHGFFTRTLDQIASRLKAALPVDAVYICNHGAMTTTETDDGDGQVFARIRAIVGANVPLVATIDPHGNLSDQGLACLDVITAYRTDPHMDQRERGAEAADLLREMLAGMEPHIFSLRLPIIPPNVSLFSHAGPFADLQRRGMAGWSDNIANVSVMGGFAFSDTRHNGLRIIVTGRDIAGAAEAERLCLDLAKQAWADRDRFVCEAMGIEAATERAVRTANDPSLPPTLYSDLGDNCGAGGPANTIWLLEAFHAARVTDTLIAGFCDAELVQRAWNLSEGEAFDAEFVGDMWGRERPARINARAILRSRHEGPCVGRHGIYKGRTLNPGRLVLLDLDGLLVQVSERRFMMNDPILLEVLGIDLSSLRGLVVKMRGSFRVAYDQFFAYEDMVFVDTPGRTSPVLSRHKWRDLPRPAYPLDRGFDWRVPESLTELRATARLGHQ